MKKYVILGVGLALCLPTLLFCKEDSNRLIGYWLTGDKSMKIEIYENGDSTFAGKIIWLKEPNTTNGKPPKDIKNPDEKLRERPLLDLVILTGLVQDGAPNTNPANSMNPIAERPIPLM